MSELKVTFALEFDELRHVAKFPIIYSDSVNPKTLFYDYLVTVTKVSTIRKLTDHGI